MEIGKIPPQDIEAEQAILGSMLTDQEAVTDAIEVLKAEDFYRDDNKYIFEAMGNLYAKGEPIDIITVSRINFNAKIRGSWWNRILSNITR